MNAVPKHRKYHKRRDRKCYLLFSFLIPCILVGIGWICLGVYPFGSRQILVTDCWHQYYPFLNLLHEKLRSGSSLLYTWQSGLGTNFLGLMAYYAASPLNLLTILVPTVQLREAMTLLLLAKIGLAGLFMGMFLRGTFRRNDSTLCLFSIGYALCSYIMGYYWNVIWMDTVALFPLVMLGLVRMIRDKRCSLYVAALALSLLANYYIGLFTCLFTVLAFFCVCLFTGTRPLAFVTSGIRTLLATLLGVGMSAVLLLPAYYALQLTYSAENTFPTVISFYERWIDLFANLAAFREPNVKEGLPNLYCGLLSLLLSGMFLSSRTIRIREKVAAVLVLAFLLLSCNMNVLNYIWHGFHFTNMLPYRFSFLISFVLVTMGYRAFIQVLAGHLRRTDCVVMTVLAAAVLVVSFLTRDGFALEGRAVWVCGIVLLCYLLVLWLHHCGIFRRQVLCLVLSAGVLLEMFLQVHINTQAVGTSDYTQYPTQYADTQALLSRTADLAAADGVEFYRTEMTSVYTLNDPALYGYNGVSQFSSMANQQVTTFLRTLGLPGSEAGNRYYYALTSPVTNMFLGIRYLLSRTQPALDTATLNELFSSGSMHAYENRYTLPIGFLVDEQLLSYNGVTFYNPFEAQNAFFAAATGIYEPLYTPIDVTHTHHTGMAADNGVYRSSYGTYTYHIDENVSSHVLQYNYIPQEDAVLYAYFWADGVSNVEILQDEKSCGSYPVTRQQGFIAPIGSCKAGVKASVKAALSEDAKRSGSVRIYVYQMNQKLLEQGYEQLKQGSLQLTEWTETALTGTVEAAESGKLCYFSIPQEEGWTATLDGAVIETETIGGAMLAVRVPQGRHTLHLEYRPQGFTAGLLCTVVSCSLWTGLCLWESTSKKRRRKRTGGKRQ